jgi:hypothetical protein
MSALLAHNNHLNLGMALSSCDLGRHSPSYFYGPELPAACGSGYFFAPL